MRNDRRVKGVKFMPTQAPGSLMLIGGTPYLATIEGNVRLSEYMAQAIGIRERAHRIRLQRYRMTTLGVLTTILVALVAAL